MLGDGSSDAGSKELYDMMDRVRQKKTGTTKQAPKLANSGGMLPA
jgi:ClpP class serine protease